MIFAIDFDGTIVENKFPLVGDIKPNTLKFIQMLEANGHKWILWTMREGERLYDALEFLAMHNLHPNAVNDNLKELKDVYKNNPRKVYADCYIDDHNAFGVLLPWSYVCVKIDVGFDVID